MYNRKSEQIQTKLTVGEIVLAGTGGVGSGGVGAGGVGAGGGIDPPTFS